MLKLVIHDGEHAAGLFLNGCGGVRQLLTELKAVPETSSASLLLEELALRCLERGWRFIPADPLVHGCAAGIPIVEIHLDARLPGTPFVSLHQPGKDGSPYRWLHGTLDGLVTRLRLPPLHGRRSQTHGSRAHLSPGIGSMAA
ncbi:hypothetical protein [Azospirillum soli]|uniref:hypothetical protein n=1 Tax=Azospirillum soli TaxID=1304799 RepID=UPI001AE1A0F7|nr:hypothetical protein [Azospirillum soli]MBP2315732.1 hypothetical protein [Azospirillum soli]